MQAGLAASLLVGLLLAVAHAGARGRPGPPDLRIGDRRARGPDHAVVPDGRDRGAADGDAAPPARLPAPLDPRPCAERRPLDRIRRVRGRLRHRRLGARPRRSAGDGRDRRAGDARSRRSRCRAGGPHAIRDLLPYGGPASLASFAWAGFRNGDYADRSAPRSGPHRPGSTGAASSSPSSTRAKVSAVMTQMAFPVLARTEDADAMFALRRRMVRLLTVMVFPAPRPARRHRAGPHPVAVRPGVGAGGAADPDPRRRGRGHRRDRRRRHGAHGRRPRARVARPTASPTSSCYVGAVFVASSWGLAAVAVTGVERPPGLRARRVPGAAPRAGGSRRALPLGRRLRGLRLLRGARRQSRCRSIRR